MLDYDDLFDAPTDEIYKDINLDIGKSYNFPFNPYAIQTQFSAKLYEVIDKGLIGLMESPTGTGKTMSLICGALTWLLDYQENCKKIYEESRKRVDTNFSLNWLEEQSLQKEKENETKDIENFFDYIESINKRISESLSIKTTVAVKDDKCATNDVLLRRLKQIQETVDDEDFFDVPQDNQHKIKIFFASRTHTQLQQFIGEIRKTKFAQHQPVECQDDTLLGDNLNFSIPQKLSCEPNYCTSFLPIKLAILASRKSLCINEHVCNEKTRNNIQLLNENCQKLINQMKVDKTHLLPEDHNTSTWCVNVDEIDLISSSPETEKKNYKRKRPKKKKANMVPPIEETLLEMTKCQYFKKINIDVLTDFILSDVKDIEDIVDEGKHVIKACPYFATKAATKDAQLIVLPYQLLLDGEALKANGLTLDAKNSIVIIDEAHNLVDTLTEMHSVTMTGLHFFRLFFQVNEYNVRYGSRLGAHNQQCLHTLIELVKGFIQHFHNMHENQLKKRKLHINNTKDGNDFSSSQCDIFTCRMFLNQGALDNFNLYSTNTFINRFGLPRKLMGIDVRDEHFITHSTNSAKKTENLKNDESAFLETYYKSAVFYPNLANDSNNNNACVSKPKTERNFTLEATNTIPDWYRVSTGFGNPIFAFSKLLTCLMDNDIPSESIGLEYESIMKEEKLDNYKIQSIKPNPRLPLKHEGDDAGKIFVYGKNKVSDLVFKYVLTNPSRVFKNVVVNSKAVILAGGTMKPFEEIEMRLLFPAGVSPDRIATFECGHIIPPENISVIGIGHGLVNKLPLEFTYQNRTKFDLMLEFGSILLTLAQRVPGGIICFFPSYKHEQAVFDYLSQAHCNFATNNNIQVNGVGNKNRTDFKNNHQKQNSYSHQSSYIDIISTYKRLFRESTFEKTGFNAKNNNDKNNTTTPLKNTKDLVLNNSTLEESMSFDDNENITLDDDLNNTSTNKKAKTATKSSPVFDAYQKEIMDATNNGAILFCVASGRLSEGINFNDDLARCVVMVGMPYPNPYNPEFREKMTAYLRSFDLIDSNKLKLLKCVTQAEYMHSMCMKTVNQCIGRAIRHKNDYAMVVLCDLRYLKPEIQQKLPLWMLNGKSHIEKCHFKSTAEFGYHVSHFFKQVKAPR